jgi:1-acyl-sn-glycerol-3-phosphate acyltransferase
MLKPKKNFLITGFFEVYMAWIIKRYFHKVEFNRPTLNSNASVLLIANHFSWWDGFLLYHINKVFLKKKFHAMVLEETMYKVSFFKYLGGFSVARNSREMIASLDYAAELLNKPNNMVVVFAQGKLYSNFVDDVVFEKGAAHIAAKVKGKFQYVFAAMFTENFEHKKPTAHIYLDVFNVDELTPAQLPNRYQQHYQTAKEQQTSKIV